MMNSEARKRHEEGKGGMTIKQDIIKGLQKFIPFECGDDPAAWRQKETVERIAAYLEEVLHEDGVNIDLPLNEVLDL